MLSRQEILAGYPVELASFSELLRSLSDEELAALSRCEGWVVADVAAHVVGGLADVVSFNLDGAGTPEWTNRQVAERRGRTQHESADELDQVAKTAADLLGQFDDEAWKAPAPANSAPSVGSGVEAMFYDAYVHGDDIRAAIGRPSVTGPGLRAAVHHLAAALADHGWGPATLALDGLEELPVGDGSGARITGDPIAFVLVATGRQDPATIGLDPSVNIYP
ncbi:MAG TPA: maleylpyruvate isomerase family mycothiol-dependent enzyme [Acidimicrobiales bacterium]|nr:maleylpyruvate isomerase family mycothiol-dependent enzyme [Acidimicrobiales bacterium]